jgi:branched-subunit amino acid aminotransferase/4-amino-4-deoxychorismate lyase
MTPEVFETLRTYDGVPALLDEHLARLGVSEDATLRRDVLDRLAGESGDVVIRIVGRDIEFRPLPPDDDDVDLVTAEVPGYAYPIKLVDRELHNGLIDATDAFDVLIHDDGMVIEGTRTNVFALTGDMLVTPPLGRPLPGVTRAAIAALAPSLGLSVEERDLSLDELREADEVLVTNSLRGVKRVATIDGEPVGGRQTDVRDELDAALLAYYRERA